MSGTGTTRLLAAYFEEAVAPGFLSTHFQTPPRNIHATEKVEIDIMRDDEDVAVVVTDLSVGGRQNEATLYTSKAFTPPIYMEEAAISSHKLINRMAGQNPFDDPDFDANATEQAFVVWRRLERKIRRAIELMASQVFQGATLSLIDKSGNVLYTLNFQGKAEHFATVSTAWAADGSTGTPLVDIENHARTIRRNGKKVPNKLVFGKTAWQRFMINTTVRNELDNRRIMRGMIDPGSEPQATEEGGASYMGKFMIGEYPFELWLYDAYYRPAGGQGFTSYVNEEKIIFMSKGARLDLSYGRIPLFPTPNAPLPFLPNRVESADLGLAMTTNAWVTPDGRSLKLFAGTRPLTIPTAIDTFGTLDVVL